MNTHDKYELPPLPSPIEVAGYAYEADDMQDYARQAIAHARPFIIEQFLNESGQYVTNAASRQAAIDEAISQDRQQRGEPFAWFQNSAPKGEPPHYEQVSSFYAGDLDVFPLYEAPQPAKPVANKSLMKDEIQLANWLLRDPTSGERLVFASVPVNEGSFSHVRMRSESGEDWTLTVRLKQGWLTAEQRAANFWSAAKAEKEGQPAEPVKAPGLDDVERDATGETWMGMRVAAWEWIVSSPLGELPHHATHWSTGPKDAERLYRESDIRTLLARYGQPAQPAESVEPLCWTVLGTTFPRDWTNFGPDAERVTKMNARDLGDVSRAVPLYTAPVAAQPSVQRKDHE